LFKDTISRDSGVVDIPLCAPEIRGNEWSYIRECLDTKWVSSAGGFVERFENEISAYLNAKYAVATVNGTAALHIALLVAGVGPDDEVLVSTLTFIASVNAIRYVGAWPVFIDSEPDYWQMESEKVVEFLGKECRWLNGELRNRTTGRQVKAILPVHILGHPCDMDPILEVAREYNLVVIEDVTESLGARYKGGMVGHLGHIACFSFNGNKIITTGGGGMIVTDNQRWAQHAAHLTMQAKVDPMEYVHDEIGYNYRLTNIQAAMGCAQLEQLESFIDAKRRIAMIYTEAFRDISGLTLMREAPWARSIFWMYTILVDSSKYGISNRSLLKVMADAGIQTRPLWQPIHRSPAYADLPARECTVADWLNQRALSLPCSVGIKDSELQRVIKVVRSVEGSKKN